MRITEKQNTPATHGPAGRIRRRHGFNLIELVLAIGLVAVGLCSIMALFPIGIAASRDAMAEGYAADAAEQMLHYVKYNCRQDWDSATNDTNLPLKTTTTSDVIKDSAIPGFEGLFSTTTATPGYFIIERTTDTPSGTATDFTALVKVWKESIPGTCEPYTDSNSNGWQREAFTDMNSNQKWDSGETYIDENSNSSYDEESYTDSNGNGLWDFLAVRVVVEIQWPLQLPSSRRQTKQFILEVAEL
jgi:type II secretory pathway pseudopilin PulG